MQPSNMIVTINTDASFSAKRKRGTYAFWIKSNEGKIAKSGILKSECKKPEIAEFRCVINAFFTLTKTNWEKIDKVVINTDCLNVIHLLNENTRAIRRWGLRGWGSPLVDRFNEMKANSRLAHTKVEIRHVRAHVSKDSPRQWVNDWCDENAKLQMNKLLKKLDK